MFDKSMENFPLPIIEVNKNGIIVSKNYMSDIAIPVIKAGAYASRYTDIDFSVEKVASGYFCNLPCTYFTVRKDESTLLFLSFETLFLSKMPFDIIEVYREKLNSLSQPSSSDRNLERRYVRSVRNNLLKANYFSTFSKLFSKKYSNTEMRIEEESVVLSRICSAIETAASNYLEGIKIDYDIDCDACFMTAKICETDIINIILNSLMFCVLNSSEAVTFGLKQLGGFAELSFSFVSNIAFEKIMDSDDISMLNSSLALMIAFKLAEIYSYDYYLAKDLSRKSLTYSLVYRIPVTIYNKLNFSASDFAKEFAIRSILNIFFDEAF